MTPSRPGRRAGLTVVAVALLIGAIAVPRPATAPSGSTASASGDAATPAASSRFGPAGAVQPTIRADDRSLVLLDFLPQVAEEVEVDPIDGHPDSDELTPFLGEPTAFGTAVVIGGSSDAGAITRCGLIARATVGSIAAAFNDRLAADQRVDPKAIESRTLLHWGAAEGFASLRIFSIDGANRPSCDHAEALT